MGLSPYTTPADAGVFCVILVNTAISISIVKGMVRSILHVIGINFASWEEYSIEGPSLDPFECRGTPSGSYMEEFRSRTPAVRYDSLCISNHPTAQECPVCLADFNHDAEINCLSCGHVFHKLCLEKWLKSWNVTCPLCRDYIMPQEGEEDTCPM
ncbi:probable E3 ubiquitin-protein ligase XERICO [Lycium ferocissimum]|uniref:probable E3 ubiquitin-protein ligase XERICO n=1 Tax=Lycium ferocissimum TaxID=112874 RepID=UPI0028169EC3|nr:probable E3 ubiquitin-protein ligase XERICO [Lycium ferocissimum]XP_059318367.1 probable E3 ubiquitin-protein ligase XERICO [Lycium ferocissimum]